MALAPLPSQDEITEWYVAGTLPRQLAQYYEDRVKFADYCVDLHNRGAIDLVRIPLQESFASLQTHPFFTAQTFFCGVIPRLKSSAIPMMRCCQALVLQAGADGAAGQPNLAFRAWCQNNPREAEFVVELARSGDEVAGKSVTFALQALNQIAVAVEFVRTYADERRVFGMTALAGMAYADERSAMTALAALEPFVGHTIEDRVRANALISAFEVLQKQAVSQVAARLIDDAVIEPQANTLYALARILSTARTLLAEVYISKILKALENVDPEHSGTFRVLDLSLWELLRTNYWELAIGYLSAKLKTERVQLSSFSSTVEELSRGDPERLFAVVVRWLLSSSLYLSLRVDELVGLDRRSLPFDSSVKSFDLSATEQVFLCRKAIGFLFIKPVVCSSMIVSVLRAAQDEAEDQIIDLLFDPVLTNYSGEALDYLNSIRAPDSSFSAVQTAIARINSYHAAIEGVGAIKELFPSEHQRNIVQARTHDTMKSAMSGAQRKSVFRDLIHRSTVLYGKSSLAYVADGDGNMRPVPIELKSVGTSFELPRGEVLDPVGLDYTLRVFKVEGPK